MERKEQIKKYLLDIVFDLVTSQSLDTRNAWYDKDYKPPAPDFNSLIEFGVNRIECVLDDHQFEEKLVMVATGDLETLDAYDNITQHFRVDTIFPMISTMHGDSVDHYNETLVRFLKQFLPKEIQEILECDVPNHWQLRKMYPMVKASGLGYLRRLRVWLDDPEGYEKFNAICEEESDSSSDSDSE